MRKWTEATFIYLLLNYLKVRQEEIIATRLCYSSKVFGFCFCWNVKYVMNLPFIKLCYNYVLASLPQRNLAVSYSLSQTIKLQLVFIDILAQTSYLRSLYCKKTGRNFSPIILSHNLGTFLRQNHKKNWGSPALIQRYDFLKFNMG
jgi:hypothetical protein